MKTVLQEKSFRGIPIPEVIKKQPFQVADSKKVIDKIVSMNSEEQKKITIESVHYQDNELSDVKLTTGDIVPVETAIALAENDLLSGYRAGRNAKGDKTLKAVPSFAQERKSSIHQLPKF